MTGTTGSVPAPVTLLTPAGDAAPSSVATGCGSVPWPHDGADIRATTWGVAVAAAEHWQRAAPHLHLDLHTGTGAVRTARRAVQEWAGARGASVPDQHLLALLTTEVVSNAVRHGPPDGPVQVDAAQEQGQFVVRVCDASSDLPVLRRQPPDAIGGRGVQIIDHLAADWGVERRRGGKVVWFRIRPGRSARGRVDARGSR